MARLTVCGHLRQPSVPLRRSRWLFVVLFLVSGDALPGKPSVAEGLARRHRDMTGFATSVLNLLAFSIYGPEELLCRGGPLCSRFPALFAIS